MPASTTKPSSERRLRKITEVAERLNCSDDSVWRWIARGELPVVRMPGRVVRVDERDLKQFIERSREA